MFEIFRDGGGHWCARRSDGLVGGVFRDRAEAERFARMEEEVPSSGLAQANGQARNIAVPGKP
jgi:hypothetical protein